MAGQNSLKKKEKILCCTLHFCRNLQNVKIYAHVKENFFAKSPAIRKLRTFCNSGWMMDDGRWKMEDGRWMMDDG